MAKISSPVVRPVGIEVLGYDEIAEEESIVFRGEGERAVAVVENSDDSEVKE